MIVSPGFRWFILGMLLSGRNSGGGGFRVAALAAGRRRRLLRRWRIVRRRRPRGALGDGLSEQDRARISAAIRANEARTSGEIICVGQKLLRTRRRAPRPDRRARPAVPWVLMAATSMALQSMLSLQVLAFLVLLAVLGLPRLRTALILAPPAARRPSRPWSSSSSAASPGRKSAPASSFSCRRRSAMPASSPTKGLPRRAAVALAGRHRHAGRPYAAGPYRRRLHRGHRDAVATSLPRIFRRPARAPNCPTGICSILSQAGRRQRSHVSRRDDTLRR